jgi:RNA polymerase sporulation-specific sigma factor
MECRFYELTDEVLIDRIRGGDSECQDYLINKYKNLAKIKAHQYFITGADKDDIIQEGMIGLFKAIREYSADRMASFYSFADICITRQIYNAIKISLRKKHSPLNGYISLNNPLYDEPYMPDLSFKAGKSPEIIVIEREDRADMQRRINESLSEYETKVLALYIQKNSYREIADITGKTAKSVDNAIQRIKGKLGGVMK